MQEYLSRHNDASFQNFMQYLKWDAVSSSTFRWDSDVVVVMMVRQSPQSRNISRRFAADNWSNVQNCYS